MTDREPPLWIVHRCHGKGTHSRPETADALLELTESSLEEAKPNALRDAQKIHGDDTELSWSVENEVHIGRVDEEHWYAVEHQD